MTSTIVLVIGFAGQGAYFLRTFFQWIESERRGRSVTPGWYWMLSTVGGICLLSYAHLRHDPVIATGQSLNLLIYLRNLQVMRRRGPSRLPAGLRGALPLLALLLALGLSLTLIDSAPVAHDLWLTAAWLAGWVGQGLFMSRFPLQWHALETHGRTQLGTSFWTISLIGSLLIAVYALSRHDIVILLGQAVGLLAYTRNLQLAQRAGNDPVESDEA